MLVLARTYFYMTRIPAVYHSAGDVGDPLAVTPLGLTIYGLAITFMGRQKQKNRWIPGAGIELTAIAMSIPVSYQLRYQIDFEISAG